MNDGESRLNDAPRSLDFEDLKVLSPVGRGAKGVVFVARTGDRSSNECVALKVISKALVLQKKAKNKLNDNEEYKRVSFEEEVLRRFDHPLLPRLHGVLETDNVVGFAIDYCHGGTLHSLRKRQTEKMFSDDTIRFYAVELVLALEYLHNLGIVYRDLKPENVMIQQNGHIMLVDFDLSKKLNPKSPQPLSRDSSLSHNSDKQARKRRLSRFYSFCNSGISPCDSDSDSERFDSMRKTDSDSVEKSNSFVGTEEYVAPEIVAGKGHAFGADWWSLGVVLYEMLYGTTPFMGNDRKETFYRILTKKPELTGEKTALRDLIGRLLEKDPERRIQVDEIKSHDFFKGVKWDTVLEIARPPYIPENDVENKVGFSKNDVELFVDEVFFPKSDDDNGEKNNSQKNNQSHIPNENNDFLIF